MASENATVRLFEFNFPHRSNKFLKILVWWIHPRILWVSMCNLTVCTELLPSLLMQTNLGEYYYWCYHRYHRYHYYYRQIRSFRFIFNGGSLMCQKRERIHRVPMQALLYFAILNFCCFLLVSKKTRRAPCLLKPSGYTHKTMTRFSSTVP